MAKYKSEHIPKSKSEKEAWLKLILSPIDYEIHCVSQDISRLNAKLRSLQNKKRKEILDAEPKLPGME